jgi:hypothetical protein
MIIFGTILLMAVRIVVSQSFSKFTDKVVGVFHAAPYTERRMKSTPLLITPQTIQSGARKMELGFYLFGTVHRIL